MKSPNDPAATPGAWVIGAALFAVFFWGGSPVGTKLAVTEIPPVAMSAVRVMIAAPFGLALALGLGIRLPSTWRQRGLLLLCSFCAFVGFPVVFSLGAVRTSAIHGAMILAMLPVFTGAIANLLDRRWPQRRWWAGCLVAILGEAVLISGRGPGNAVDLGGDLLVLLSATIASTGYVVGARLSQAGYSSQGTTYWGVVIATLAFLPFLPAAASGMDWGAVSVKAWAGLVYLSLGVSMLGYVIWYWALGKGGIARIGVLQFLQPVAGVLLARLILGEALTVRSLSASAIVLIGVFIASRR